MAKGDEGILYLIGFGAFFFFTGFRRLRLRRKAIGMATSRARSMAMGTVELSGIADRFVDLSDPIFKRPCTYYNIKVEELRRSGKNSNWVTIHHEHSDGIGFFCKDATGRVLVLPKNAELHFNAPIVLNKGGFTGTSPEAAFMARWNTFGKIRVTAHILRMGDPIYVIGCALPTREMMAPDKPVVPDVPGAISMAAQLKKDPKRMKELDTNQDGTVDAEEWERGLAAYKKFLEMKHAHETELAKEAHQKKIEVKDPQEFTGLVTSTPDAELIFAHSEEDMVGNLGQYAFLGIIGGGISLIVGLIFLLQKFI